MRKLYDEFKTFAMQGNLIEIAIGLVLGLAFTALVSSLVSNLVMPIVGILFGQPSFNGLTVTINDSVIYYGAFLTSVVTFLLTALGLFLFVVKPYQMYKARTEGDEGSPDEIVTSEEVLLLREIRDSLKTS